MANARHSSASVEHHTPPDIIQRARYVLGNIVLDPASSAEANAVVQATYYFFEKGLERAWGTGVGGGVLLNPPGYHKVMNPNGAAAWWDKLISEWASDGGAWSAIYIGFSLEQLQTCQSFQSPHPTCFPTCFPRRRIAFYKGGEPQKSPTHGNFITCVTTDRSTRERFAEVFSPLGHVLL
jgi:hypothetical protein